MPRLPQTLSRQTLSPRSPNVRVNPQSFASQGRAIEKVGKVVNETAQRFRDLRNLEEYTSSMTEAKRAMQEVQLRAQQDDDIYSIHERYSQELQEIKNNAMEGISDRETQIRFGAELDSLMTTSDFNIRSIEKEKQIDRSKATLLNDIDQSKRDYYNASSPLERQQMRDQVHFRLDEFARLGVISEETAAKNKIAWDDDVRIGQVYHDAALDPEFARENVENGAYDLNAAEKEEALNEIADLVKKRKQRQEVALFRDFNKTEQGVMEAILADKMTVADLDKLELLGEAGVQGGISKDFATVARRAIKSAEAENPKIDLKTYANLLDELKNLAIDPKTDATEATLKDLMKFRVNVLNAYSKGEITESQATNHFLKKAANALADKLDEAVEKDLKENDPTPLIKIYSWTDQYEEDKKEARARIFMEMEQRVLQGQDRKTAVEDSIRHEQERRNPDRAQYEIGDTRTNRNGVKGEVVDFDDNGDPIWKVVR